MESSRILVALFNRRNYTISWNNRYEARNTPRMCKFPANSPVNSPLEFQYHRRRDPELEFRGNSSYVNAIWFISCALAMKRSPQAQRLSYLRPSQAFKRISRGDDVDGKALCCTRPINGKLEGYPSLSREKLKDVRRIDEEKDNFHTNFI